MAIDKATTRLSDLAKLWQRVRGQTLKDAKYRYTRLIAIAERLDDPLYVDFTGPMFAEYRIQRITEVSISTVNHETRYLRAMFNELIRLEFIDHNPIKNIRTFTERETELGYLDEREIKVLFEQLEKSTNPSVYWVAKICLSTGARWGEAEKLKWSNLIHKPYPALRYVDTKNGKNRTVKIAPDLMAELRMNGLFSEPDHRMFKNCRTAFRYAVKKTGIKFPEQQNTHILRHTYASHFLMKGGDIFVLQRILGHSDIKTTMRYSHFSPQYLDQAVEFSIGGII